MVEKIDYKIQIIKNELISRLSNTEMTDISFEKEAIEDSWGPLTLAHGYPGLIILFSELDRYYPGENYDTITHQYMLKLRDLIESAKIQFNTTLFSGYAGINYAVHLASQGGERYTSMLNTLDMHLYEIGYELLQQVKAKHKALSVGSYEFCYDLITGITGLGRYALESNHPKMKELLNDILVHLVAQTEEKKFENVTITNLFSPHSSIIVEEEKGKYPIGYINLGLAHGISGPLALFSLALKKGIVVDGQKQAISILFENLSNCISKDSFGYYYKRMVGIDEIDYVAISKVNEIDERFDAWCYGSFGIVIALALAYEATGLNEIKELTIKILKSLIQVPIESFNLRSSILCHGYGGNMQILNRILKMEVVKDEIALQKRIEEKKFEFLQSIVNQYNPESKFCYSDVIPSNGKMLKEDKVGYLEGVTGVLLSVISCTEDIEAKWDGPLLMS